jgi:hypothetical protein
MHCNLGRYSTQSVQPSFILRCSLLNIQQLPCPFSPQRNRAQAEQGCSGRNVVYCWAVAEFRTVQAKKAYRQSDL